MMNDQLQKFARDTPKAGLRQCTEDQKLLFNRMYSPKRLNAPIDEVVDAMDANKLDWAMQQVQGTLDKAAKRAKQENVWTA